MINPPNPLEFSTPRSWKKVSQIYNRNISESTRNSHKIGYNNNNNISSTPNSITNLGPNSAQPPKTAAAPDIEEVAVASPVVGTLTAVLALPPDVGESVGMRAEATTVVVVV